MIRDFGIFLLLLIGCMKADKDALTRDAALNDTATIDSVAMDVHSSMDTGVDVATRACPTGELYLDLALPDGRTVRECLPFEVAIRSANCQPEGIGGRATARTIDGGDPNLASRVTVSSDMIPRGSSSTLVLNHLIRVVLSRAGECPQNSGPCLFQTIYEGGGNVCNMRVSLPSSRGGEIALHLENSCTAVLVDSLTLAPVDSGRTVLTIRAFDYRGPLRWLGELVGGGAPLPDGGLYTFPDCGSEF